jgi:hypothetical protein
MHRRRDSHRDGLGCLWNSGSESIVVAKKHRDFGTEPHR